MYWLYSILFFFLIEATLQFYICRIIATLDSLRHSRTKSHSLWHTLLFDMPLTQASSSLAQLTQAIQWALNLSAPSISCCNPKRKNQALSNAFTLASATLALLSLPKLSMTIQPQVQQLIFGLCIGRFRYYCNNPCLIETIGISALLLIFIYLKTY